MNLKTKDPQSFRRTQFIGIDMEHCKTMTVAYYVKYTIILQNRKAVSAYFTSRQILPFGFAEQYVSWDI